MVPWAKEYAEGTAGMKRKLLILGLVASVVFLLGWWLIALPAGIFMAIMATAAATRTVFRPNSSRSLSSSRRYTRM
jgi:hypothetical protein